VRNDLSFLKFIKQIFWRTPGKFIFIVIFIILAGMLEGVGFTLFSNPFIRHIINTLRLVERTHWFKLQEVFDELAYLLKALSFEGICSDCRDALKEKFLIFADIDRFYKNWISGGLAMDQNIVDGYMDIVDRVLLNGAEECAGVLHG